MAAGRGCRVNAAFRNQPDRNAAFMRQTVDRNAAFMRQQLPPEEKAKHQVPAHRHDVRLSFLRGTDEDKRSGFEVAPDFRQRVISFAIRFHS